MYFAPRVYVHGSFQSLVYNFTSPDHVANVLSNREDAQVQGRSELIYLQQEQPFVMLVPRGWVRM
jgi:hypothetical protein